MKELVFAPRGILQINDARIVFRNFKGEASKFNREGDRNFAVVIDTEEQYEALINDTNKYGDHWNVKKKEPREVGDVPFMYLPVKVKFGETGPNVYLISGNAKTKLSEASVAILDDIDIVTVNMDIRPYDGEINGKTYRTAYLKSIEVVQEVDRFADGVTDEIPDDTYIEEEEY